MALRADDVDLGRDRDLVERFQNGDPGAFDDLYRRYFDRLHRYCLRHTRDSHEAEEVAQEAFVKALRSMHSLRGERRFYPWMTVIARRITIDRHRKLSRVELTAEPDLGSVEPDVDHLFAAVDAAHVREAMDNVGPRHREVLLLRETQGLSYAQIADHLDVPVTTVEALLHRARKALRREYAAVAGESRGVFGLPLLGWLGARAGALRAHLGDRWVEIGAVAAPIVVGAATAAIVLVPGAAPPPAQVHTVASPVAAAPTMPPAGPTAVEPDEPIAVVANEPAPATAPAPTPPSPAAPTVAAGPAHVFTGPTGTDHADAAAQQMPLSGTIGPATGGVDPPVATDDATTFVQDTVQFFLGGTP